MMTPAEVSRLKRSYHRNVSWCRFWVGVSLAIATLTFTFAVDRVFEPPPEPIATTANEQVDEENIGQVDLISFVSIAVVFWLILLSAVCAVLSARFRTFYRRNDAALVAMERKHQEATP
jgi:H+/gluconate symporter-like permease